MSYEQFVCAMLACTKEKLLETEIVERQEILKNNGVVSIGLAIRDIEKKIAPIIYLEDYYSCYQAGDCIEELADHLLERSRNALPAPEWEYENVLDFRKVKDCVVYKLINAKKNEKLLREVPNLPMLDFAIVFYLLISAGEENCSVLIRNAHMNLWKIPISLLYQCAKENTPKLCQATLRPMTEYMKLIDAEVVECPMLILSNETGVNGATALLYPGVLKRIYEHLECKFYLLPASIHEFLIVPEDEEIGPENLLEMVREVNRTQVSAEEVLADSVYYFDGKIITKM